MIFKRCVTLWIVGLLLALSVCSATDLHPFEAVLSSEVGLKKLPTPTVVSGEVVPGHFPLFSGGYVPQILVSDTDFSGVKRVAQHLADDLSHVTGSSYEVQSGTSFDSTHIVIVGTIGKNMWIDTLIEAGKIDVSSIRGKWESSITVVVETPFPDVTSALVIVGSDKRGTIYGMFELSRQIGVSPWYWWADVPVERQTALFVAPEARKLGEPKVKYRGIFINDEGPALEGWVYEKFGKFNHEFYAKVFELILRQKGNYLWPAMWGKSLFDDDPQSAVLADEYGVILGTSHHEPLMRAHVEWSRYGEDAWNYDTNAETLQEFWGEGIKRMGTYESIVTVGMRGDGDEPMSEASNIALLERIVKEQREIIEEVTGTPIEETPQSWALYKEVQDYYDKGMRVPDDITLLLCDDNWGNIRKLPSLDEAPRSGSYGIYYHFDYVGGPRNYKWINTNQISRVWEQMHLAYEYGATRIWIVNVGDLKPMEFPITFFLDYAWDPDQWPAHRIPEYVEAWARDQFGEELAPEIAEILNTYTRFNSRRKHEMLDQHTYSLIEDNEYEQVTRAYVDLVEKTIRIGKQLPEVYQPAYYQLVQHPVEASANLYELYLETARNHLYAKQGRAATHQTFERVRELFETDVALTEKYHTLLDGKWNHQMSQNHIGYTYWQQPKTQSIPELKQIDLKPEARMGVAIEGSSDVWPVVTDLSVPVIDSLNRQVSFIEIFNYGSLPFEYSLESDSNWLVLDQMSGEVNEEVRIGISVNWDATPVVDSIANLTIKGAGQEAMVKIPLHMIIDLKAGFIESRGHIVIEAAHYTDSRASAEVDWLEIPQLGRTLSAMTTQPGTVGFDTLDSDVNPFLEYLVQFETKGELSLRAIFSPVLNYANGKSLRVAFSIDDEAPQVVNLHEFEDLQTWEKMVGENSFQVDLKMSQIEAGTHRLRYWMIDPGVVLQKLILSPDGASRSYLGPNESYFSK